MASVGKARQIRLNVILNVILNVSLNVSVNLYLSLSCGSSGCHRRGKTENKKSEAKCFGGKFTLDKKNGMVYYGWPYCDTMPIYAIPYSRGIVP